MLDNLYKIKLPLLKPVPKLKVGNKITIKEFPIDSRGNDRKNGFILRHHIGKVTGIYPSFINFRNKKGYIESINNIDIRTGRIEVAKVG